MIMGDLIPRNELLALIAERIRTAAAHLKLSRQDLFRVFSRHSIFEGQTGSTAEGTNAGFILVETHHLMQGKVGKGALKLVFPEDLLGEEGPFREAGAGVVEVVPPPGVARWEDQRQAEEWVKQAMREMMTGESLSMSLKCQATGAPFAGSEGLLLCAVREFDPRLGRYLLQPALKGDETSRDQDKEMIERMMNEASEMLTRAGRIGYNRIVHAAETNSTLTSRLGLQLPTNVVEGHLRALLRADPNIIIGDEDMTPRLREILEALDYSPTRCALARAAASMQMDHAIFLFGSRRKLRQVLAGLSTHTAPTPTQYQQIVDLFFGTGEIQQTEDQLHHHREPILRALAVVFSTRNLDECGDPLVLEWYLKILLDNQRIMLEYLLLKRLPPGTALSVDWFDRAELLTRQEQQRLASLMPPPHATAELVKEHFWRAVNILSTARARIPRHAPAPYLLGRKEYLERAIRAITSGGDVIPSGDRILFFALPFTYECVTPRLGVITRKPLEVCGSELRPQAMAVGAIMAVEILLKKLGRSRNAFEGMTVTIEGLGNAGKNVARLLVQKGARIVGVSDSRGALVGPGGFAPEVLAQVMSHKDAGKRLDTFLAAQRPADTADAVSFHPDPEWLKQVEADLLVLTAFSGSIHERVALSLPVKIVCELTGAAVTEGAKRRLNERHIPVIPDNLASSGGLLVSLSEMLQNSAGQVWDRRLEEDNLFGQLSRSYDATFKVAAQYQVDLPTASDVLALRRMCDLALYREQLELLSARLAEQIRTIQPGAGVLVVSDNDEDGVASAAIMHGLIAALNPRAEGHVAYLNESFRSEAILDAIQASATTQSPIKQVFVLDRSFPLSERGQHHLQAVTARCGVAFVTNHDLPTPWPETGLAGPNEVTTTQPRLPEDLGVLLISPQTLKATMPSREFPTAMILKEIARQLITNEEALNPIDWQAAVGSCLDMPTEASSEWLLFFTQFNPDRTYEAARAIRLMTRANGFLNSIHALVGVVRPDLLETNEVWRQFMAEYHTLNERVQLLVEKIVVENRRRPFTAHYFTHDEVASPTPLAGNELNELDFYHWISELLTQRGNLGEKPILVGQLVQDEKRRPCLGIRIRSPRGVDLMEVGLPRCFKTAGLPNTAITRIPIAAPGSPEKAFQKLVDAIWMKTTSPMYLGVSRVSGD